MRVGGFYATDQHMTLKVEELKKQNLLKSEKKCYVFKNHLSLYLQLKSSWF